MTFERSTVGQALVYLAPSNPDHSPAGNPGDTAAVVAAGIVAVAVGTADVGTVAAAAAVDTVAAGIVSVAEIVRWDST